MGPVGSVLDAERPHAALHPAILCAPTAPLWLLLTHYAAHDPSPVQKLPPQSPALLSQVLEEDVAFWCSPAMMSVTPA